VTGELAHRLTAEDGKLHKRWACPRKRELRVADARTYLKIARVRDQPIWVQF